MDAVNELLKTLAFMFGLTAGIFLLLYGLIDRWVK
jgi:hypothetical protein